MILTLSRIAQTCATYQIPAQVACCLPLSSDRAKCAISGELDVFDRALWLRLRRLTSRFWASLRLAHKRLQLGACPIHDLAQPGNSLWPVDGVAASDHEEAHQSTRLSRKLTDLWLTAPVEPWAKAWAEARAKTWAEAWAEASATTALAPAPATTRWRRRRPFAALMSPVMLMSMMLMLMLMAVRAESRATLWASATALRRLRKRTAPSVSNRIDLLPLHRLARGPPTIFEHLERGVNRPGAGGVKAAHPLFEVFHHLIPVLRAFL